MPPIVGGATRKSHTKSRKGCATCKRRHIRCDENKPEWCVQTRLKPPWLSTDRNVARTVSSIMSGLQSHQNLSILCSTANLVGPRCDFMDGTDTVENVPPTPRGPNLLSNPHIERELEAWRTSGVFPFPELQLQYTHQFQSLSRIELRLIHHLCTIYREMRLADFGTCTLWVQELPR